METLMDVKYHVVEKAYETIEECKADEEDMKKQGFVIISSNDDIFEYFRKYQKRL